MSYLVIALGALLALCGALAAAAGYPIIQVERGWAFFIAGTMAFSGGIVTIALGLILHRLAGLALGLKVSQAELPQPSDLLEDEPALRHAGHGQAPPQVPLPPLGPAAPAPAGSPHASGVRAWPQRPGRTGHAAARNGLKPRVVAPPATARMQELEAPETPASRAAPGGADAEGLPREPAETAHLYHRPPEEPYDEPWLSFDEPTAEEPGKARAGAPPAPAPQQLRQGHGSGRESVAEAHHFAPDESSAERALAGSAEEARAPDEAAVIEAILREELHVPPEIAPAAPGTGIEASPAPGLAANFGPDHLLGPASHPEALGAGPSAIDAASLASETLTIAGRYDSEGTSYIMYSDGSIEARTDNSVFHFKSMSELKRFMDKQAQGSKE